MECGLSFVTKIKKKKTALCGCRSAGQVEPFFAARQLGDAFDKVTNRDCWALTSADSRAICSAATL